MARNRSNLATATGHNQDPAQELAHLKGQVAILQKTVDDGQVEMKNLAKTITQQSTLMAQLIDKIDQLSDGAKHPASPLPTAEVSPESLWTGNHGDRAVGFSDRAYASTSTSTIDRLLAKPPADPPVDNNNGVEEEQVVLATKMDAYEGKIPLASGQNACQMNSVEFLVKLAARGLDIETMGGDVFYGTEVNPSNKSKFVYVYQFFKSKANPSKWDAYCEVGAALHSARLHKNKPLKKQKEQELNVLAKDIVQEAQAAYLKEFVKSEKYLNAKKRTFVYNNARKRVLTIGFGGKVGPQKKKVKK